MALIASQWITAVPGATASPSPPGGNEHSKPSAHSRALNSSQPQGKCCSGQILGSLFFGRLLCHSPAAGPPSRSLSSSYHRRSSGGCCHHHQRQLSIVAGKEKRRRKQRERDEAWQSAGILGLLLSAGAAAAGVVTMLFSLPLLMAMSVSAAVAAASILGLIALLAPIIPGALFAFKLVGVTSAFFWTLFDRLLCWAMAFNFVGGLIGFYGPSAAKLDGGKSKWIGNSNWLTGPKAKGTGGSSVFDVGIAGSSSSSSSSWGGMWLWPTVVSIVPGVNGAAWLLALLDRSTVVYLPAKVSMVKNAIVYGAPALLSLLAATIITPPGGAPFIPQHLEAGSAWWVSLGLGAIHLQLLKAAVLRDARQDKEGREQQVEKERKMEEELVSLEMAKELEEFDAKLSQFASPQKKELSVEDWSVGDVCNWLKSNGFARYVAAFSKESIDGEVLLDLTMDELRDELGVKSLGERKRLMDGISKLRG